MPRAIVGGLDVEYAVRGAGPALLMLAPGGFDATMEKWRTGSAWTGLDAASARSLFDRDTPPGTEPEELMGMRVPALIVAGDDPAHAASGAHYLRGLLPRPELWPVMPPEQTTERVVARIVEFGRAHPIR